MKTTDPAAITDSIMARDSIFRKCTTIYGKYPFIKGLWADSNNANFEKLFPRIPHVQTQQPFVFHRDTTFDDGSHGVTK